MKSIGISVDTSSGDVNFVSVRCVVFGTNGFADGGSGSRQLLFNLACCAAAAALFLLKILWAQKMQNLRKGKKYRRKKKTPPMKKKKERNQK